MLFTSGSSGPGFFIDDFLKYHDRYSQGIHDILYFFLQGMVGCIRVISRDKRVCYRFLGMKIQDGTYCLFSANYNILHPIIFNKE